MIDGREIPFAERIVEQVLVQHVAVIGGERQDMRAGQVALRRHERQRWNARQSGPFDDKAQGTLPDVGPGRYPPQAAARPETKDVEPAGGVIRPHLRRPGRCRQTQRLGFDEDDRHHHQGRSQRDGYPPLP